VRPAAQNRVPQVGDWQLLDGAGGPMRGILAKGIARGLPD
jgi:hypothetical protein